MKSILKKALFTTAAAAGLALLGSSGSAFAATLPGLPDLGGATHAVTAPAAQVSDDSPVAAPGIETAPSLNTNAQRFAEGLGHIGYGIGEGAAAAYIGAPQAVVDGGKYILTPEAIQLVTHNVPQVPLH